MTALQNVKPAEEVKQPKPDSLEEVRQRALFLLSGASEDGRLSSVLSQIQQSQQKLPMAIDVLAGPVPAKPTAAKGATRPCRQYSKASVVSVVDEVPGIARPETPVSASKRNRLIFGGIERPAAADAHAAEVSTPRTPGRRSMVPAFRMDIYGGSAAGDSDSSLPRGYDDGDIDSSASGASQWSIPLPFGVSHLRVQPGSKLHFNHPQGQPSSKVHTNSKPPGARSAMVLDLDMEVATPSSSPPSATMLSARPQSLGPMRVTKAAPKLPSVFANEASGTTMSAVSKFTLGTESSAHQWDVPF